MNRRRCLCCMGYAGMAAITGCAVGGINGKQRDERASGAPTVRKERAMERLSDVTYCGVYCPNCEARCQIPQRASALIRAMKAGDYDSWCPAPTWQFLNNLTDVSVTKSCREETCGSPNCGIRKCAKSKGVEVCPLCAEYPCEKIQSFSRTEPTLIFDGKRMREIGLEQWIDEQEARRESGFCYGDVRCGKGAIPEG